MVLSFGEMLRNLRLSRNLPQSKLASALEVSVSMIGLYENSSRMPSYEILIRIAHYFSVSTDELLGIVPQSSSAFDLEGLTADQARIIFDILAQFKKANENSLT